MSIAALPGRWTTEAAIQTIRAAQSFAWTGRRGIGYALHSAPRQAMIAKATYQRAVRGYSLRLPGWLWTVTNDGAFPPMLIRSGIRETPVRGFKTLAECKRAASAIIAAIP